MCPYYIKINGNFITNIDNKVLGLNTIIHDFLRGSNWQLYPFFKMIGFKMANGL
jgi:hypothetical protein